MTQQTSTLQAHPLFSWKHLWRLDGVFNLLFGDLLIFAAPSVIDFMGMSSYTTNYLRGLGVFFAFYGLWQFWTARRGTISKTVYTLAAIDMLVLGLAFIVAPFIGIEFSTLGTVIMVIYGGLGFVMAGLWVTALRQ